MPISERIECDDDGLDHPRRHAARRFSTRPACCSANGYTDVRLDDVGEAVGIAGPSVLAHFASKKQFLVAALDRGITQRMISASVAIDDADSADQALHRLVTGLAETAARNRDLFTMLLRESGGLDTSDRERILRLRRDYDDIWATVIGQMWPKLNIETARVIERAGVEAVLSGLRRPGNPGAAADLAAGALAFVRSTASTFERSLQQPEASTTVDRWLWRRWEPPARLKELAFLVAGPQN